LLGKKKRSGKKKKKKKSSTGKVLQGILIGKVLAKKWRN